MCFVFTHRQAFGGLSWFSPPCVSQECLYSLSRLPSPGYFIFISSVTFAKQASLTFELGQENSIDRRVTGVCVSIGVVIEAYWYSESRVAYSLVIKLNNASVIILILQLHQDWFLALRYLEFTHRNSKTPWHAIHQKVSPMDARWFFFHFAHYLVRSS